MELNTVRPRVLDDEHLGDGVLLQLLDNMAAGVWLLRLPASELFWSRGLAETFGFDLDTDHEVPSMIELTHPDDRERHQATVMRSIENGDDYEIELRMYKRDGTLMWLQAHGCWLKDQQQQSSTMIGFVHDVSDREQARIELKRSEDRFRAFFDQAPAAVYIKNKDSRHLYGNEIAAKLANTSLDRFLGATASDLFTPEVAESLVAVDKRVLEEGRTVTYTGPLESPGGEIRHVYDVKFPVEDTNTGERLVGGFGVDVTELTQVKQRLEDAQRLESIGLLASGIAHDFNNLIFAISGNAELAMNNVDDDGRELLGAICTATDHAAALCSQLLAVGGKAKPTKQRVDIAGVIHDSNELFEMTLRSKCRLRYDIADNTGHARIDPSLLRQICVNLILNAVQASEPDSEITIGSYNVSRDHHTEPAEYIHSWLPQKAEELVCIYVDDNGAGIHSDILSRVIEPYFTGKEQGHGLGLAAVAGIVRTNKGAIQIDSDADTGTRFSCFFPAEPPPDEKQDSLNDDAPVQRFSSAIVIDDNSAILDITVSMLGNLGIKAEAFSNGLTALERITNGTAVDFIISDISMPAIGGLKLLEKIRADDAALPVVIASGFHDNALALENDDRTWFLQKPWSLDDLQSLLDEMGRAVYTGEPGAT